MGWQKFDPQAAIDAGLKATITLKDHAHTQIHTGAALSAGEVFCLIVAYIVGFFATAGAAGVDFGMNNRNTRDVHLGGLVGIALTTIVSGGLSLLIVAGGLGLHIIPDQADLQTTHMFTGVIGPKCRHYDVVAGTSGFPFLLFLLADRGE